MKEHLEKALEEVSQAIRTKEWNNQELYKLQSINVMLQKILDGEVKEFIWKDL